MVGYFWLTVFYLDIFQMSVIGFVPPSLTTVKVTCSGGVSCVCSVEVVTTGFSLFVLAVQAYLFEHGSNYVKAMKQFYPSEIKPGKNCQLKGSFNWNWCCFQRKHAIQLSVCCFSSIWIEYNCCFSTLAELLCIMHGKGSIYKTMTPF